MSKNIRSTNLRFNLDKDLQRQAWQYLQTMDKLVFKSYNHAIALSVVDYFERHYRKEADPYLENRQREEQFVAQIVEAVELAMEKTLPLFLAALFSGMGQSVQTGIIPRGISHAVSAGAASAEPDGSDVDWNFLGE